MRTIDILMICFSMCLLLVLMYHGSYIRDLEQVTAAQAVQIEALEQKLETLASHEINSACNLHHRVAALDAGEVNFVSINQRRCFEYNAQFDEYRAVQRGSWK